ncbi:MAG: T9SS type A sorting domain-containing protein [Fluviicola sp.]|nr:T9SS type A sorting domain-containing protein [Fluviicola sp.]
MKHMLLTGMLGLSALSFGQTTLLSENFESGSGNWTLNGGSGNNQWILNAEYLGFSGLINNTPDQPASFTGGVNSTYMHIHNTDVCSFLTVCNSNFDTGSSSNQTVTMASSVNTSGYNTVTLSFWYVCAGSTGTAYGTVEYSTDNGLTWTSTGTNYQNVSVWTQETVTMPAWSNISQLKFRFKWQNTGTTGNDPAFSIDELTIEGSTGSTASVSTNAITTQNWCYNDVINLTVPFTVTGTMNVGNIYTAQLSDASGSFAAPTTIGTLNSTGTGAQSLLCSIPGGTPAGNGYRIRVNSSNPATIGADNGTNLVMHALPSVSVLGNPVSGTICLGASIALQASGASSYIWTPSTALSNIATAATSANPTDTITYTVIGTDQNGCNGTANYTVNVVNCAGIEEANQVNFTVSPNPTTGTIQISSESTSTIDQVFVVNALGQKTKVAFNNGSISLDAFAAGVYTLVIEHSTGESQVRVVKQ